MCIDHHSEELVTLTAARKLFPTRPHISTIWRWIQRGTRGHRLETCYVGGRRYTSHEAVERFLANLNSVDAPAPAEPSARRQRQIDQAEAELAAAGI